MGMNLRGQVWKRAWKKPAFFEGQDLENRAAHPHQEFPGVLPDRTFATWNPSVCDQGLQRS